MRQWPEGARFIIDEPDYGTLIAAIVVQWSAIELHLTNLLVAILGVNQDHIFSMVYSLRNSQARLDAIEAAIVHAAKGRPYETRALELLKEASHCVSARNSYAHGLWGKDAKGIVRLVDPQKGLSTQSGRRAVGLSELKKESGRMIKLATQVVDLVNELAAGRPLARLR
jgi:hypothetical protein